MSDLARLRTHLTALDGKPYPAYTGIKGTWDLGVGRLDVVWVQGDPFAAPSVVALQMAPDAVGIPGSLLTSPSRRRGLEALFARAFARAGPASGIGGSGGSGDIVMQDPGALVVAQSATRLEPDGALVARFRVGLPARGRRILGPAAAALLTEHLPQRIRATLRAVAHEPEVLRKAALVAEDAEALRRGLAGAGLIAFVADGSVLPRRSGVDDRPLDADQVVPFESPPSLRVTLQAPNAGPVSGLGIRPGVTLIAGGGFHGKSTLLRALERGVYGHAPGDGREFVVTDPDAVKIRAEDGRAVTGVDIAPFIDGLPGGRSTECFSTTNASGSTSQAAALVEALESGARVVLMDEDTTATNFMIRDRRMQRLVPDEHEPITPFVDRARKLHTDLDVSTILVVGGSGDYLDVADTVIVMRDYRPHDATDRAREVVARHPTGRIPAPATGPLRRSARTPNADSIDPRKGRRPISVKVRGRVLSFGDGTVDLAGIEQLVHPGQRRAVGSALVRLQALARGNPPPDLPALLDAVDGLLASRGPSALDDFDAGEAMAVRRHEIAAALNRLRTLALHAP